MGLANTEYKISLLLKRSQTESIYYRDFISRFAQCSKEQAKSGDVV